MYQKIYDVVEKRGRTRTEDVQEQGSSLAENMQDLNILRKKTASFIRIIKQEKKQPKIF